MGKLRKNIVPILIILLLLSFTLLYIVKSEKDVLQKNVDLVFTNAISDSMNGINLDYSGISTNEKVRCYYQTVSNLNDALNIFHSTSYKEYDNLFQALNHLYIFLIDNYGETYEIEDKLYIFEFLGKVMVYPEDKELISEFDRYLDNKRTDVSG